MSSTTAQGLGGDRAIRVDVAVKAEFAGDTFLVREMTANLSVGGMFLCTDHVVPPRSRGTLTFRLSQHGAPFTIGGDVVHVVAPEEATDDRPAGLGIQFVDLTPHDLKRLIRWVDGLQKEGSVVMGIRRAARELGGDLVRELRRRPMAHKLLFAVSAKASEIDAVVREGSPGVVKRLVDNPNLGSAAVRLILRSPRMPGQVITAIVRGGKLPADDESRTYFCMHPNAPLSEVLALLPQLSPRRLAAMTHASHLRAPIRQRVKQLQVRRVSGLAR